MLRVAAPRNLRIYERDDVLVCRGVQITQDLKKKHGPKLKDFKAHLETNVPPEIAELKSDVEHFAKLFPTIGFEKASMRYKD